MLRLGRGKGQEALPIATRLNTSLFTLRKRHFSRWSRHGIRSQIFGKIDTHSSLIFSAVPQFGHVHREVKDKNMNNTTDWKPFSSKLGVVRLILIVDWDPIGVFGLPGSLSQYDRYADNLLILIEGGGNKFEIIQYLVNIESEVIGSSRGYKSVEDCADKLVHLFEVWNNGAIKK